MIKYFWNHYTKDLLSYLVCIKVTKFENENHNFMSHIIMKILSKGPVMFCPWSTAVRGNRKQASEVVLDWVDDILRKCMQPPNAEMKRTVKHFRRPFLIGCEEEGGGIWEQLAPAKPGAHKAIY